MQETINPKTNRWLQPLTILALVLATVVITILIFNNILMTEKLEELEPIITSQNNQINQLSQVTETKPTCDVGVLCLQESKNESGIYGVAQITAHYVGIKTFDNLMGGPESCPMMAVDSGVCSRITKKQSTFPQAKNDKK
ncbi:MAG: hypothetical protein V1716_05725 [Candidatus Uhrbacteria bacterium]